MPQNLGKSFLRKGKGKGSSSAWGKDVSKDEYDFNVRVTRMERDMDIGLSNWRATNGYDNSA